jgi:hypothetical protein
VRKSAAPHEARAFWTRLVPLTEGERLTLLAELDEVLGKDDGR